MAIETQRLSPSDEGSGAAPRLPQALGERVDIAPVVDWLRPQIAAAEARIEADCELPPDLVEAMLDAGIFRALQPRELDGLELHIVDWMDLVFELSRINGSVGWITMLQSNLAMMLAPDLLRELRADAGGRIITAGSNGRIGRAVPVEGGYRFSGHWAFASGAPWATHIVALAIVEGEDGEPYKAPWGDGPMLINGLFPKAQVDYIGNWDPLGLRGTGSGEFKLDDVFVERRHTGGFGRDPAYLDRALFYALGLEGTALAALGMAQGAIDAFIELTKRPARASSYANRVGRLGKEQTHKVKLGHAHAMIRSAFTWMRDLAERRYETALSGDEQLAYEIEVERGECKIYSARVAQEAAMLVFQMGGTDSIVRGRGIERAFRDTMTATQHTLLSELAYIPQAEYLMTRDSPGGPRVEWEHSLLPPAPRTGEAARIWELDPLHSTVEFRVEHHAVGSFRAHFGELRAAYDEDAVTLTGAVTTASVRTMEALREHLLGDDFLAAAANPEITFTSADVRIDGEAITVTGELTLRGVTRPITASGTIVGPSTVPGRGGPATEHLGLDLTCVIDRRDFGMSFNEELLDGQQNLGWGVTLTFSLEFSRPATGARGNE